jgi:hypothetical protein
VIEGETFDQYAARARQEPSAGRRAIIAAVIVKVSDGLHRERSAKKRAWVSAARLEFTPSLRRECLVCGKFRSITQAHHVVPLAVQYDRAFERSDHEHEWLCPNHHTILHLILPSDGPPDPGALGRKAAAPIGECSVDEIEVLMALIRRAERGR